VTANPEITGGGFDAWNLAVALLFGVGFGFSVVDVTEAEFKIGVPSGVAHMTIAVSVNCADAPFASADAAQLTCPVPPVVGVVQVQPAGAEIDENPVEAGAEVVRVKLAETFGPLFGTVIA